MDLRVLEYFLTIARVGSLSRAAKSLHISQPSLSRLLAELEDELKVRLCDRGRQGIVLTKEGTLLKARAQEILALVKQTKDELSQSQGAVTGQIRFGCEDSRSLRFFGNVMREVRREFPRLTFELTEMSAEDIFAALKEGACDFGLLLSSAGRSGFSGIEVMRREQPCIIMPAEDPLAHANVLNFDDLAGLPLLLPKNYKTTGLLGPEKSTEDGGRMEIVTTYDPALNPARIVDAYMGYAVGFTAETDKTPGPGLVRRVLDVDLELKAQLVWQPLAFRSRACEVFLEKARTFAVDAAKA